MNDAIEGRMRRLREHRLREHRRGDGKHFVEGSRVIMEASWVIVEASRVIAERPRVIVERPWVIAEGSRAIVDTSMRNQTSDTSTSKRTSDTCNAGSKHAPSLTPPPTSCKSSSGAVRLPIRSIRSNVSTFLLWTFRSHSDPGILHSTT